MNGTPTDEYCTPWFDPLLYSPVRVGFYQVRCALPLHSQNKACLHGVNVRYWNGKKWLASYSSKSIELYPTIFGKMEGHEWRGVTVDFESCLASTAAYPDHFKRRGLVRGQ